MRTMYSRKITPFFSLLLPVLVLSCAGNKSNVVTVAAAANTRIVLEEQVRIFHESSKSEIKLVFGSSGRLTAQIMNNAPFDLFLSADTEFPEVLRSKGFGISESRIYAGGEIVFLSSVSLHYPNIEEALGDITGFALANPEQAPYGRAAVECLNYYHKKPEDYTLVYGSNVSEAAHFLLTGADYAFLPLSFLYNPDFTSSFTAISNHYIVVPEEAYKPIHQGMLLLTKKGREFYDYLLSERAVLKWKEFGYAVKE
ncbi:MAG: molybdate ABC transporter substrate-binding protein [Spirochaetales bacterium]|nr:molybdate ABC transporter substrate-binding protein [Spirochaetales bacterium]